MAWDVTVTPDQVSIGVLVCSIPRDVIDVAVAAHGVGPRRSDGKLPAHVVAYLTMGLCLFPDDDYTEVATKVTGSLSRFGCWDASWTVPTSSGISQARKRVGAAVMADVFTGVAQAVATRSTRGGWLRGWRLLAIDGFDVDLPDTPANAAVFGYAGSGENRSAFPKARVVALAECGTHAFLAAEVDAWGVGEKTLAGRLYPRLRREELLTADRNFYSFEAWSAAVRTGAALLWRAPTQLRLPVVGVLADGTYTSVVIDAKVRGARREKIIEAARVGVELDPDQAHLVRVIEYDVPNRAGNGTGELVVLLSTIVDPADARADELAAAYHDRWEEETANDQVKTHLRGPGRVLRSRLPDLVRQEIWAWLSVHYALAVLIARAAEAADIDPDRISYTRTLRLVRRFATGTAAFPPKDWAEAMPQALAEIGERPNPERRDRSCPRAVKRARHNSFPVKKPGQPASTRHPGPARVRFWPVTPRPPVPVQAPTPAPTPAPAGQHKTIHKGSERVTGRRTRPSTRSHQPGPVSTSPSHHTRRHDHAAGIPA